MGLGIDDDPIEERVDSQIEPTTMGKRFVEFVTNPLKSDDES